MSALEGALRVIEWATRAAGPAPRTGPLPLADLASPSPEARGRLADLSAAHAARLGWGSPPLGDATPPGAEAIVLAAAVALREIPALSLELVMACPPPRGAWDLVARDAVVGPALATGPVDEYVADALRSVSPLSALLDRPAEGEEDSVYQLATTLLPRAAFRRTLVAAFSTTAPRGGLCAAPRPEAIPRDVRLFRRRVLHRLRTGKDAERRAVLEIYEAALLHHRERTLAEAALASRVLSAEDPTMDVEDALACAFFWEPLWAIQRSHADEVRAVRMDVDGKLAGTKLYELARSLTGGGT